MHVNHVQNLGNCLARQIGGATAVIEEAADGGAKGVDDAEVESEGKGLPQHKHSKPEQHPHMLACCHCDTVCGHCDKVAAKQVRSAASMCDTHLKG